MSKVLIVDDEPNLRRLYRESLESDGHEVVTADCAEDCLERIEHDLPDLVVLDVRMPGMDGLEALGRILERHPRMPVVLNSAFSSYRDNFLSWTADAYLVKSSDVGPLRSTVRRLLDDPGRRAAPTAP